MHHSPLYMVYLLEFNLLLHEVKRIESKREPVFYLCLCSLCTSHQPFFVHNKRQPDFLTNLFLSIIITNLLFTDSFRYIYYIQCALCIANKHYLYFINAVQRVKIIIANLIQRQFLLFIYRCEKGSSLMKKRRPAHNLRSAIERRMEMIRTPWICKDLTMIRLCHRHRRRSVLNLVSSQIHRRNGNW